LRRQQLASARRQSRRRSGHRWEFSVDVLLPDGVEDDVDDPDVVLLLDGVEDELAEPLGVDEPDGVLLPDGVEDELPEPLGVAEPYGVLLPDGDEDLWKEEYFDLVSID
jgi:hypothetical protein